VHHERREPQAILERAGAAITISTEQGFPQWLGLGLAMRGWALAELGKREEGIDQLLSGLSTINAIGMKWQQWFDAMVADATAKSDHPERGLPMVADALAEAEQTGVRDHLAELHRLRGEMLLATSADPAEAEASFDQALTIARQQKARLFELRTAMSLARLWRTQGKQAEARNTLKEVYDWFTEGFDLADLKEARALLEELA
jgi:predicted ATPase